jgi:hypothetical protein
MPKIANAFESLRDEVINRLTVETVNQRELTRPGAPNQSATVIRRVSMVSSAYRSVTMSDVLPSVEVA